MEGFWVSILFLLLFFLLHANIQVDCFKLVSNIFKLSQYGVNMYLELVSRPLLSKYRQEMDADKLLIYLQRIYCARVFVLSWLYKTV